MSDTSSIGRLRVFPQTVSPGLWLWEQSAVTSRSISPRRRCASALDLEVRRLEKESRTRLREFQTLLTRNVAEGRKALEALLDGPLRFTPVQTKDGRRYRISGAATIGPLCTTDCVPKGIRTPVTALKGPCPGPG